MAMKRIAVAAWALIPAGVIVFAGGRMLGQEPDRKGAQGAAASHGKDANTEKAAAAPVPSPKALVDPLEEELLRAARQRYETQRAYYEKGRIAVDRFVAASQELMAVERMVSRTKEEVLAAIQRHVDRLKEIKAREEAEIKIGRGTAADLAEANQSLLQAEVLLKNTKMLDKASPDLSSPGKDANTEKAAAAPVASPKVLVDPLEEELLRAARQRLLAQRDYYEEGRITIDRFLAASQEVMVVERMVSRNKEEALAAIQRHVDRLKEIETREDAELKVGKGTVADLAEAHQSRLEAEVLLKKTKMPDKTNPDLTALERRLSEVERKLDLLLNQGGGDRTRR